MEEVFTPAFGFEERYEVSNKGNVKNVKTGKQLSINKSGDYNTVDLWNGKHNNTLIHRLMLLSFHIPNPLNLPCVNHRDENKRNNFLFINPDGSVDLEKSNLEWCDYEYNANYGTKNERVANTKSKPVVQLKNGVPVFIWKSQLEATLCLANQRNSGNIFYCLKGRTKTAFGFEWKYF